MTPFHSRVAVTVSHKEDDKATFVPTWRNPAEPAFFLLLPIGHLGPGQDKTRLKPDSF